MKVELLSVTPNAEKVIERAGRVCYRSQSRITEKSHVEFIKRLVKAGHLSVLEHALATFELDGVSRALTHQLVRHRLASYSQQSQRYVRDDNFDWVTPPSIEKNPEVRKEYIECMGFLKRSYERLTQLSVKPEDARFILPNACISRIVFSANFRQLRHIIALRGSPRAQWEIREAFIKVAEIMKEAAPSCFFDFNIDLERRTVISEEQGKGKNK